MSRIEFDDGAGTITVMLNGLKRIVTLKSSVTIHAHDVASVDVIDGRIAVRAMTIHNLTRLRGNGNGPRSRYYGGVFTKAATMEHEYWDVDDTDHVVMITMLRGPYSRVFLSFDDPQGMVDRIRCHVRIMNGDKKDPRQSDDGR